MAKRRRGVLGDSSRAVGYLRASTGEQHYGPAAQARDIDRWAAQEGVQLVAVFFDAGVSDAVPLAEREALQEAIRALHDLDAGVLVAGKRDRLARGVVIAKSIEEATRLAGARLRTSDGMSDAKGSAGVLQRGMHDLLGEWEREVIRERTSAALDVKRARGERIGSVPFGFQLAADGVHLEPCPAEQATLERIRGERAKGVSLRALSSSSTPTARQLVASAGTSRP